jgi:hypothetical protein
MKKVVVPGVLAAIVSFIASMAIGYLFHFIDPSLKTEYENTNIFRPWSDPLMNIYYVYPFLLSIILAWLWDKSKQLFSGNIVKKALTFAFIYWLASNVPGMVMSYSSFQISAIMTISWSVSGFVQVFVAMLVIGKMNK